MVKTNHDRQYIIGPCHAQQGEIAIVTTLGENHSTTITITPHEQALRKKRVEKNQSNKAEKKEKESKEERIEEIGWQTCTNRLISSFPLKAYPLLRMKDLLGYKPFKSVPSNWIISTTRFSYKVVHVEEVIPFLVP